MRVLHLIEPGAPGGGGCTLRMLVEPIERLTSAEHDVIILGHGGHAAVAARCGVPVRGMISPPAGQPALAVRGLTRALRIDERARGGYDVIHGWTLGAALAASLAAPDRARVGTVSVGPVTAMATHFMVRLLARHPMPLLATSAAVEAEHRAMGIRPEWLRVLAPGVDPVPVEPETRAALRRRWKVDAGAFVVGLLAEPVRWGDARTAVNVVARVAVTGRPARLVIHQSAPHRADAERWAAALGMRDLIVIDDAVAEPWSIVGGLDAALLFGGRFNALDLSQAGRPLSLLTGGGRRLRPMPGIMPLLWAMSAGVPVIAEASDAVRGVVRDGISGLLVDQHDFNAASDRIVRLHDDPTIAGRIGTNARAFVRDRFSVAAYCVRLKRLYECLAAGEGLPPADEPDAPDAARDAADEVVVVGTRPGP